jgi:hypothetical protein
LPTPQEIQATQGTRLSSENPWDSYSTEMNGPAMSPELAAQVAAYAATRNDGKTSSQTQEILAENREINEGIAKQYQWINPTDYADIEARIGRVHDHRWLINGLRSLGVNCYYRQHPHQDKLVLLWARDVNSELEVACWVQYGQMPELSIMNFDEHGAPLAERRRGWRTCLLQLMLKKIVTEEQVNKVFGKPRYDAAFDKYNTLVKAMKMADLGLTE